MDQLSRAYSVLQIKAVSEDQRVITGIATSPSTDRQGDIIDPLGVSFKNPMPLLWQHQSDKPVGMAYFDKPTKNGITFKANIASLDEPGTLKDRLDEAWQSVKLGLVKAVSIGFRPIEYSFLDKGGVHFTESEVMELSLVTIPAQQDAVIQQIKSIDAQFLAASGRKELVLERPPTSAGVSAAKSVTVVKAKEARHMPMSITEQISAFENTLAAKSARMEEIMNASAEKGETLDGSQSEEYDTCRGEVKSVKEHLDRLRDMQTLNLSKAQPVQNVTDPASGSIARASVPALVKAPELPKGTAFARYAMAIAASKGNLMQAEQIAHRWDNSTPHVSEVLKMAVQLGNTTDPRMFTKAAISAGTSTDATWGGPLVNYQVMASEFIEYLRPLTILGRVNGFRRVPFNVRVPAQTSGSTAYWVGEGQVKPVSALAFSTVTLTYAKLAAIVILTDELVRFSDPSAEMIVRGDLAATIAAKMDRDFVDPTVAATGSSPASITNGVTPTAATGTTPDALRADIKTLFQGFLANNLALSGGVWLMTQQQAIAISLMRTSLGVPEFPGILQDGTGGTLAGFPIVASEAVPSMGGSPTDGSMIVFMLPNQILLADDGSVTLDSSNEASLQMDSAPDSPVGASTSLVSMFQQNMMAIRAERYLNWVKARSTAVGYISYARYSDS
jgi:HK97 family phage major capsid protein/HK97 family phage prohead protease